MLKRLNLFFASIIWLLPMTIIILDTHKHTHIYAHLKDTRRKFTLNKNLVYATKMDKWINKINK